MEEQTKEMGEGTERRRKKVEEVKYWKRRGKERRQRGVAGGERVITKGVKKMGTCANKRW